MAIAPKERLRLVTWLASPRGRPDYPVRHRSPLVSPRPVGMLIGHEGVTPQQLDAISLVLADLDPTEIHHPPRVSRALQAVFRTHRVPVFTHRDMQTVLKRSHHVIAAPRESTEPIRTTEVWEMVGKARRRSMDVTVIVPDGSHAEDGQ